MGIIELKFSTNNHEITAELLNPSDCIETIQDVIEIAGNCYFSNVSVFVVNLHQISSQFANLSTGFAGEMCQKFVNYRVKLEIMGDISHIQGNAFAYFVRESNKGSQINFIQSGEQ